MQLILDCLTTFVQDFRVSLYPFKSANIIQLRKWNLEPETKT